MCFATEKVKLGGKRRRIVGDQKKNQKHFFFVLGFINVDFFPLRRAFLSEKSSVKKCQAALNSAVMH